MVAHSEAALGDAVRAAAQQLVGEGWTVRASRLEADAPWHLAAQRMARWRVIQVLPSAAGPTERLAGLLRLGRLAQVPTQLGSMELWRAHLRPGG